MRLFILMILVGTVFITAAQFPAPKSMDEAKDAL